MFKKFYSLGLCGIEAFNVDVEIDVGKGLPGFTIIGLPDASIKEAKERIKSAIKNSGMNFPNKKILVNLSPADIKKEGTHFDLAMAVAIIGCSMQLDEALSGESVFLGELSLDGKLRPIKGVLSMLIKAKELGYKNAFVPLENVKEASAVDGIKVYASERLSHIADFLKGEEEINPLETRKINVSSGNFKEDFSQVKGNYAAKRAAEISAAGNHNMIMIGPPGSGKTMIARRIASIMPDLTDSEIIEISRIYSCSGLLDDNIGIVDKRPFRSPHHTATQASIIGGGRDAKPGEVVLSHRGVLFLDEIAEFDKKTLECLRQPIEDGFVDITRLKISARYPSKFLLVSGLNPCPCGYYGHPSIECKCSQNEVARYLNRLSGPLLDRFDLFIEMIPMDYSQLTNESCEEKSSDIKSRVEMARLVQKKRFAGLDMKSNSEIQSSQIEEFCCLNNDSKEFLKKIFEKFNLTIRSYYKLLKVARTIADVEGSKAVQISHISEAFSFRKAYYSYWR
ncbi:magnesium chelatase family protein [Peptoclostridium litorale DSM 5388]|uniref:Competence protein ComM n=1 Tax=Peptoclostridium litorale DSM 5388 TaxID=1121324 RepID=A0A069RBN4_PEPLI|nr:YifB family Mg chelatase-like AAA ATPase [Peptoclostridium litorale]KDR94168.1 competence protein ComM [Peptoclostridium litorale DSM 5388]SIN81765.1 magnesium chelatase family protein [Peptoclostridium litorale DSM 5388]